MVTARKTTSKKKPAKRAYTRKPKTPTMQETKSAYESALKADLKKLGETAVAAAAEALEGIAPAPAPRLLKHAHYFRRVAGLQHIDVYRVLDLFGVTDPALAHAVKKLLVAGGRGAKAAAGWDASKDVQEAIDTLERWQAMQEENYLLDVNHQG